MTQLYLGANAKAQAICFALCFAAGLVAGFFALLYTKKRAFSSAPFSTFSLRASLVRFLYAALSFYAGTTLFLRCFGIRFRHGNTAAYRQKIGKIKREKAYKTLMKVRKSSRQISEKRTNNTAFCLVLPLVFPFGRSVLI